MRLPDFGCFYPTVSLIMLRSVRPQALLLTRRFSLVMDPLRKERIGKSQAESNFPLPMLVSFDLWGTLYTPKKPVPEQYYDISHNEFGIKKLAESIAAEFPTVFSEMSKEFPNYGKYTENIKSSDDWWHMLVARLYQLPLEDVQTVKLYERLMSHFESAEAYELYSDVKPVLEALTENKVPFVAATNSDDRARNILDSLGIGHYFSDNDINLSYDVGYAKPDRRFYSSYFSHHFAAANAADPLLTMTQFLERTWHIGDDYDKDFVGAVRAGCNGVYLDRLQSSVFFQNAQKVKAVSNDCFEGHTGNTAEGDDLVMLANNRVCVSGLQPLLRLFDL